MILKALMILSTYNKNKLHRTITLFSHGGLDRPGRLSQSGNDCDGPLALHPIHTDTDQYRYQITESWSTELSRKPWNIEFDDNRWKEKAVDPGTVI